MPIRLLLLLTIFLSVLPVPAAGSGDPEHAGNSRPGRHDADFETLRQARRYLRVLRRRPAFGTALKRMNDILADRDAFDAFIDELVSDETDSTNHLIAAMLQVQRGDAAAALRNLRRVEQERPEDPVVLQVRGRACRDAGNVQEAIAALEKALAARPDPVMTRSIHEDLARLYEQNGEADQALRVWQHLEAAFPKDRSVQEDVARLLQQGGRFDEALERWKKLAEAANAPEERVRCHLAMADVYLQSGRPQEAERILQDQLPQLRPGSWLSRVVSERIERLLLASDGSAAVVAWYEQRHLQNPDDHAVIHRLADLYCGQGDTDAADALYAKAIARHPASAALRGARMRMLADSGRKAAAARVADELLTMPSVSSADLEFIGHLRLHDERYGPDERHARASEVWMRLRQDPKSVEQTAQVARLHRDSGMTDRAASLYEELTRLQPDHTTWHEELGRCLYRDGRREEALAVWFRLARKPHRSFDSLMRLSEILESVGEQERAVQVIRDACSMWPTVDGHLRLARLLKESGQMDASCAQLEKAAKLCTTAAERQRVREQQRETWESDPRLAGRAARAAAEAEQDDSRQCLKVARMYHVLQQYPTAVEWVERAVAADGQNADVYDVAAEIFRSAGLPERAAQACRRLAERDPSRRAAALRRLVELEQQMGRTEAALDAAGRLAAERPASAEACRLYAQLCFESGRDADGIQVLRGCLRRNPQDDVLAVDVAWALAERFQSGEAIGILWRCFRDVEQRQSRQRLLESLLKIHQSQQTTEELFNRLQTVPFLTAEERVLAEVHILQMMNRLSEARTVVENGIRKLGRRERLLRALVEVAEAQQDFDAAAAVQKELAEAGTDSEDIIRLAQLRFRSGRIDEVELAWVRDAREGQNSSAALRSIDRFLAMGRLEAAELMSSRLAAGRPDDWRVLYRLALIQWKLGHRKQAVSTLRRIVALDLPLPHRPKDGSLSASSGRDQPGSQERSPAGRRIRQVTAALSWIRSNPGNEHWAESFVRPPDYGAARCSACALLWLAGDTDILRMSQNPSEDSPRNPSLRELTDRCAVTVAAGHFSDRTPPDAAGLLEDLERHGESSAALLAVGLITRAGAFAVPEKRGAPAALPADRLRKLVLTFVSDHPDWTHDVGGWSAIIRRVPVDDRPRFVQTVWRNLLDGASAESLRCGVRLAAAAGDVPMLSQAVRHLRKGAESGTMLPGDLSDVAERLLRFGIQAVTDGRVQDVLQTMDLCLELHAVRYVSAADADDSEKNGSGRYRLRPEYAAGFRTDSRGVEAAGEKEEETERISGRPAGRPVIEVRDGMLRFITGRQQLSIRETPHLDRAVFTMLFLAAVRQDPAVPEAVLIDHLRRRAAERHGPEWIGAATTLGLFRIATGETDAGMQDLVAAVEQLQGADDLTLMLVRHLHDGNAEAEAMRLLDSVSESRDRRTMIERERLALEISSRLPDRDRMQVAVSRLRNLALDRETSDAIAEQLERLGRYADAEPFRRRGSPTVPGRAAALGRMMESYHDQGNDAAAARIAEQILLRPAVFVDTTSVAEFVELRRRAVRLLQETGYLDAVIRRLKQPVRMSGTISHDRFTLVELLQTAGRESEAERLASSLREELLRRDAEGLRLVRQLERQGQLESAATVCRYLLEADTQLFYRDYYRFIRLFEYTGRLAELAGLIDRSAFPDAASGHWGIQQLVERLLLDPDSRAAGLSLFRRAWTTWPGSREALLANVGHDAVWSLEEVFYHYLQQAVPDGQRAPDPWSAVSGFVRIDGRGRASGSLTRLLRWPVSRQDVSVLQDAVRRGLERDPDWPAGGILMALADIHAGRLPAGMDRLQGLLPSVAADMPAEAAWITGTELVRTGRPEVNPIVVRLLEYVVHRQQEGRALLKSDAAWHAGPEYLLLDVLADSADSDRVMALTQAMLKRDRPSVPDPAADRDARQHLLERLTPKHPRAAAALRSARSSVAVAAESSDAAGRVSGQTVSDRLLEAVRKRLLDD